jgi:hypothetical protein
MDFRVLDQKVGQKLRISSHPVFSGTGSELLSQSLQR